MPFESHFSPESCRNLKDISRNTRRSLECSAGDDQGQMRLGVLEEYGSAALFGTWPMEPIRMRRMRGKGSVEAQVCASTDPFPPCQQELPGLRRARTCLRYRTGGCPESVLMRPELLPGAWLRSRRWHRHSGATGRSRPVLPAAWPVHRPAPGSSPTRLPAEGGRLPSSAAGRS